MQPIDWILLLGILSLALWAIIRLCRHKKRGNRCAGCPAKGNACPVSLRCRKEE